MHEHEEFIIYTFNANGLGDFRKRKDVFDYLRTKNGNIYLLQETHLKSDLENIVRSQWGCDCVIAGHDSGSRGVAILFKNNFDYKIHNVVRDVEGRYILIDIEMLQKRITLANVYAPSSGDHPEFFDKLKNEIVALDNELIIVGGDWNIALNPKIDTNHPSNVYRVRSREKIIEFMDEYDMIDIYRTLHSDTRKYSWRRFNGTQRSRLDFFLISEQLGLDVAGADIVPGYCSDHSLVYISFETNIVKRNRPHWKFNNSLLRDKVFADLVKETILDVKKQYAVPVYDRNNIHLINDDDLVLSIDDQLFFEMLLLEIRGKCISYGSYKKKEATRLETEIMSDIRKLEENVNADDINVLEQKKQELFELRQKKLEGMIIRSRAKWLYEGEKPTKYFCNLEKRNFVQKSMCFIQKEDGSILHDRDEITGEAKSFYEKLYSRDDHCLGTEDISHLVSPPTLSQEESASLEGLISHHEVLSALKRMKNDKSPGSDGYTVEFFKFFFAELGTFIVRSINSGFHKGELSVTQKQGVIICIPKDGKDKKYLKNWRPITLLNTVYKIASSCIAERMKTVLPKLINEDQKGFLKGRYMGENIRLLYDTLLYASKHNIPGLLLIADFAKAFDCVSWAFIDKTLNLFNFGNDIKRWIRTFYTNIKSCMYVNGQYSDWFDVKRGTRQGDPLSPYLFLICAEILAIMIRNNKNICGLKILDEEVLLSQFADDTTFFLDGSKESFVSCIRTLQMFATISGLKINYDKTMAVWIGSKRHSNVKYMPELNLNWNPETFRVLGFIFSVNIHEIVLLNYEDKLTEMRKLLNTWSKRNLTPFGKITVLKTLIVSKITHLLQNLPDPDEKFLLEVNKLFYNFLWDGKTDKIKRTVVSQTHEAGGLKMIDIKSFLSALKINWLKRILCSNGKITKILKIVCPSIQNMEKLGSEYINVILQKVENPFWRDVLKHYKKLYGKCVPTTFDDFVSECLHYNANVCREKRVIHIKNWIDHGVVSLGHFFGPNGYLSYDDFKAKFPHVHVDFILYKGILCAIKSYQKKLNIDIEHDFVINDALVWRRMYGCTVKSIYACLVENNVSLKCIEKWEKSLNIQIDSKMCFRTLYKTTYDSCLRWFQYRLLYQLLPTGRFLYLRKLIESPLCSFCKQTEETLLHLFWDCPRVQNFWLDVQDWIRSNFRHCDNIQLSKELIFLGLKDNVVTDRIFDLFVLVAKYHIFTSKLKGHTPNINVFVKIIKSRFAADRYQYFFDSTCNRLFNDWQPYTLYFL